MGWDLWVGWGIAMGWVGWDGVDEVGRDEMQGPDEADQAAGSCGIRLMG